MNILKSDNSKLLAKIAIDSNMNMDKVFAIYSVIGNDIFFCLDLLEGMRIQVPTHTKMNNSEKKDITLIEFKNGEYSDYKKDEILTYNDVDYRVYTQARKILGHWYLPVIRED